MFAILALVAATSSADNDQLTSRMAILYDQICLKAFPDDKVVVAIMEERKAHELTAEQVKVTMGKDPARGWELTEENATVWLEFPPFHACSIRWMAPQLGSFESYKVIISKYKKTHSGFRPTAAFDEDLGDIHVHSIGEDRTLPDGSAESLFIFDQHINNPARRAAGETRVSLRFVHQLAAQEPADTK
jgi:hypothetical protein